MKPATATRVANAVAVARFLASLDWAQATWPAESICPDCFLPASHHHGNGKDCSIALRHGRQAARTIH